MMFTVLTNLIFVKKIVGSHPFTFHHRQSLEFVLKIMLLIM
ncbi:unnamed protein product [Thelazia callipaeda]|uniref:Uncharacterized protein n=1 Tax=Thelazia callipaeda TaxID=103827 RepID=A0A0N5CTT6_THECL|nr:unnamed protein product [Thelazia callipaeda]